MKQANPQPGGLGSFPTLRRNIGGGTPPEGKERASGQCVQFRKEIRTGSMGRLPAGTTETLNLENLPAGQYYLMVSDREQAQTLPFQLVK